MNDPIEKDATNNREMFAEDMSSVDFQLDAYLDGTLSPERAADFERAVATDAGLARQVDAARRVDAELREMFAVPTFAAGLRPANPVGVVGGRPDGEPVGSIGVVPARVVRPAQRRGRVVGLAAAGLLLVAAALVVRFVTAESDQAVLAQEFERQVDGGFTPAILCTTNEAFAEWTRVAFGQPLEPRGLPSNVELLGWSTSSLVPGYAGLLLARVDGQGVLVVMDRPAEFGSGGDGRLGKLHTFERRVGGVRMIEVTPLGKPMLVDSIVALTAVAKPGEEAGDQPGEQPGGNPGGKPGAKRDKHGRR